MGSTNGVIRYARDAMADLKQNQGDLTNKVIQLRNSLLKYNKTLTEGIAGISFNKIQQQLNCFMISQPFLQFKATTCDAVLPGIVELMAVSMLIGFFNLFNSIFGVCFVIRNKVDVPIYKDTSKGKEIENEGRRSRASSNSSRSSSFTSPERSASKSKGKKKPIKSEHTSPLLEG